MPDATCPACGRSTLDDLTLVRCVCGWKPPSLAGTAELSDILGVTKQRVQQLHVAGRLPEPIAVLAATPVWDRAEVETYAATRCRCGHRKHSAGCPAGDAS